VGGDARAGRLLKHSDFERVYKQGKRHFSANLTVFYLRQVVEAPNGDAAVEGQEQEKARRSRVGFTVGKALGGAVVRNRIKRRMREAVRLGRAALTNSHPVDIVINPKKVVLTMEFSALLDEVGRALETVAKKVGK
jgi:ribonuclease P protein component